MPVMYSNNSLVDLATMNNNLIFETYLLINEILSYVRSLISRQLQNFAELLVDSDGSIAFEGLLQRTRNLLEIKI
jgi:hypothetical protein